MFKNLDNVHLSYSVNVFSMPQADDRDFQSHNETVHSRDMKTQHIKFEILNERPTIFSCSHIQLNFVLNMLVIGRICNANFHPFNDVRDDVIRSLDVCHRQAWKLIESDLLRFDSVYNLQFRIQTNFGQISSTQL